MSRSLFIKLGFDLKAFSKSSQNIARSLKKTGKEMKKIGGTMSTFVTLPILAIGAASIKMASDLEESTNKSDVAFGNSSKAVKDFAKTTLNSFGIAESSSLEMASTFGDMGTSMGISKDKAAEMSKTLVGVAGDMASFKNISIDRAQTALNAVFTGETESLKTLGIVMTQAELNAFAMAKGINKTTLEMTGAEKVALRYQFILDRTANSQGDFEKTGGNAANQMRIFEETLKELSASFGQILLPVFTKVIKIVNKFLNFLRELNPETKKIIVVVASLAAAIGPLIFIIGSLTVALGFLAANPIVLIITGIIVAIGLLVAAFFYVRNNAEQFATFFYNLWVGIANTTIESIKNIIAPFLYLTNLMGMPIEGGVNGYLDSFKLTAITAKKEFQTLSEAVEDVKGQIKDTLDTDSETDSFITNNKKIVASTLEVSRSWKGLGDILSSMKIEKEFNPNVRIDLSNVKIDVSTLPDILTEAQEIGIQISDALVSGLERMVVQSAQLMGEFVGNMLTGSDKVARQDFGKAFLGMIGDFMQEFGAAMVGIGIAQIGIQAAIASMNPALAIAGGVALIAAGAVLSNVSKKGLDSNGGGGGGGIDAAPAPSYSGGGQDYSMNTGVRISGRDLILVQERERTFRR